MQPADPLLSPRISVVIPVYNGAQFLGECLQAVFASDFSSFEVIVVNDHSSDTSAPIALNFPCTLIEMPANVGAAAARNRGASDARGDILFFLDADILVRSNTLSTIAATLDADRSLSALFGSFAAETVPADFFSQYKNLVHHYTHQCSREEASTFCSGFGAIRRDAFRRINGFKPDYRFLEDIELGYRMNAQGIRVLLCKDLQLTHCKRYSFFELIRSDVCGRAIPWTRLMLERGIVRNDLNTQWYNVLSVPTAFLIAFSPALHAPFPCAVLLCLFLTLNFRFLALTYAHGGPIFAVGSCLMCWFSYIYSGIGAAVGIAAHLGDRVAIALHSTTDWPES